MDRELNICYMTQTVLLLIQPNIAAVLNSGSYAEMSNPIYKSCLQQLSCLDARPKLNSVANELKFIICFRLNAW